MKVFFKIYALYALTFTAVSATAVRSAGLGLVDEFSWMVNDQLPMIYVNPARIASYKNSFYFEYRNNASTGEGTGGILLGAGSKITMGFAAGLPVNRTVFNSNNHPRGMFYDGEATQIDRRMIDNNVYTALNTAIVNSNGLALAESTEISGTNRNELKNRSLNAYLAYEFNRFSVAAELSYAYSKDNQGREKNSISEELSLFKSQTVSSLGVFWNPGIKFVPQVDFAVRQTWYYLNNIYDENDLSNKNVMGSLQSSGSGDTDFFSHATFTFVPGHLLHARFSISALNSSTEVNARSQVSNGASQPFDYSEIYERKGTRVIGGLSDEMRITKRVFWYAGFQIEYEKLSNQFDGKNNLTGALHSFPVRQELSRLYIPILTGLEGKITEEFRIRLGLTHSLKNLRSSTADFESYDSTTTEETRAANGTVTSVTVMNRSGSANTSSAASFGISYVTARFSIDWLANINFLREGPNFVSGKVNDLSLAVAMSYRFDDRPGDEEDTE